jgi:type I restriction enzyme S subunit
MTNKWTISRLSDICNKITDGSHNPPKGINESEYLMLSSKNVYNGFITYDDPRYLTLNDFNNENKRTNIEPGNVLLTIVGTIGRSAVIPPSFKKITLQRSVAVVKNNRNVIDSRFLMYYFQNELSNFEKISRGVAQKGIYLNTLKNLEISYPSLTEQKRIVNKLDAIFENIEKVKKNTERNLQNTSEFFESQLQKIFSNLNTKYDKRHIGDVCKIVGGGTPSKDNQNFYQGSILWATVRDMKNDKLEDTEFKITTEAVKKSATNIIPAGNIIIATRVGLGKVCMLKNDTAINQDLKAIIPKKSDFMPEYLFWYFKSISQRLIKAGTGATVKGVKIPYVYNLAIPITTIETQKHISTSLNQVSSSVKSLEENYKKKLVLLDELKKSVLAKAFRGEL